MILILSTDGDVVTNDVTAWLHRSNAPFYRMNDNDIVKNDLYIGFNNDNDLYFTARTRDGRLFHSDEIKLVWFRKFGYFNAMPGYEEAKTKYGDNLLMQARNEYFSALQLITYALRDRRWLLRPSQATPDKIAVLSAAQKAGLRIPVTHILNNREKLNSIGSDTPLITKSLRDAHSFISGPHFVTMFTTTVKEELIPDRFIPSLVQEKIEKLYEIRVFYLLGDFYSMAIFSQNDPQTSEDFRKYNWEKPNRYVPYELPEEIRQPLADLMDRLQLDTGSIDMIRSTDGGYVFLEVNPVGQLGMISRPCNIPLEKIIAQKLIQLHHETIH